jgi:hypothetical protein
VHAALVAGASEEGRNMSVRLGDRLKSRGRKPDYEPAVVLPEVCPECGGAGYLDHINLVRDTKMQSCQDCHLRWETPIT